MNKRLFITLLVMVLVVVNVSLAIEPIELTNGKGGEQGTGEFIIPFTQEGEDAGSASYPIYLLEYMEVIKLDENNNKYVYTSDEISNTFDFTKNSISGKGNTITREGNTRYIVKKDEKKTTYTTEINNANNLKGTNQDGTGVIIVDKELFQDNVPKDIIEKVKLNEIKKEDDTTILFGTKEKITKKDGGEYIYSENERNILTVLSNGNKKIADGDGYQIYSEEKKFSYDTNKEGTEFTELIVNGIELSPVIMEIEDYKDAIEAGKAENKDGHITINEDRIYQNPNKIDEFAIIKETTADIYQKNTKVAENVDSKLIAGIDYSYLPSVYAFKEEGNNIIVKSGGKKVQEIYVDDDGIAKTKLDFNNKGEAQTIKYTEAKTGKIVTKDIASNEMYKEYTDASETPYRDECINDDCTEYITYNLHSTMPVKITYNGGEKTITDPNHKCATQDTACKEAVAKLKSKVEHKSMGNTIMSVFSAAAAGRSLYHTITGNKVKQFDAVVNFFKTNPLGQLFTLNEALFCRSYIDRASGHGTLLTPYAEHERMLATIAAHAEAEVTQVMSQCTHDDNCSYLVNSKCNAGGFCEQNNNAMMEKLYKITFLVNAQTQDMDFNIILKGPSKTSTIFKSYQHLEMGDSLSRMDSDPIIERSHYAYTQICIDARGSGFEEGEYCNAIISTESKRILQEQQTVNTIQSESNLDQNPNDPYNHDW